MSGSVIGGFEIISKIGQGGMGAVYKARQISLDRIVALKVLPPSLISNQSDVERFKLEARAAARLSHEGIVHIHEAGEADGICFYAMDYVDGTAVGKWLKDSGRISQDDALNVILSIANALDYAWKTAGIVHRDIKPDNILIDSNGVVKVVDLGLVKMTGSGAQLTMKDEALGTPNYCSPEQAIGDRNIDCRTDIYSAGAMLYHMVTGRLPFGEAEGSGAMVRHVTDNLPDPRDFEASVSAGCAMLIARMMAKKPEDRYGDWSEVIADIGRVIKKKLPASPLASGAKSTVLLRPRNEDGSAPATGRIIVRSTSRAPAVSVPPAAAPKKSFLPLIATAAVVVLAGAVFVVMSSSRRSPVYPVPAEELRPTGPVVTPVTSKPQVVPASVPVVSKPVATPPAVVRSVPDPVAISVAKPPEPESRKNDPVSAVEPVKTQIEKPVPVPEAKPALPAEAVVFRSAMEAALKKSQEACEAGIIRVGKEYIDGLKKAEAEVKAAGELDTLLAVRKEIERVEKSKVPLPEEIQGAPQKLKAILAKSSESLAQVRAASVREQMGIRQKYVDALAGLQKTLTAKDAIAEALLVQAERNSMIEELKRMAPVLPLHDPVAAPEVARPVEAKPKSFPPGFVPSKVVPADLAQKLELYYSLNNRESGSLSDESSRRRGGKLHGGKWTSNGISGWACVFEQPGWHIESSVEAAALSKFSIAFWIKPEQRVQGARGVFSWSEAPASKEPFISVTSTLKGGESVLLTFFMDGAERVTQAVPNGEWVHVVIVADESGQWIVYLNSAQKGLYKGNLPRFSQAKATTVYWVNGFYGTLDEAMIFNTALSGDEVRQLLVSTDINRVQSRGLGSGPTPVYPGR